MMRWLLPLVSLASVAVCTNFPWEEVQLTEDETSKYPDIAFGDYDGAKYTGPRCKIAPGDPDWPPLDEWHKFNQTLGGALLKPTPPGAACYDGPHRDAAQCDFLLTQVRSTRFYSDNPISVLTDWPTGNSCPAVRSPVGDCTQGGFPEYVVNATTVRHIQLAVNFARNRYLRLVVKNAGHDFNGRSSGFGALSIWTHHLKSFEYIPEYTIGPYTGRVARAGAGIEVWEIKNYMNQYNMTMGYAGGETVGVYGGWIAGGGHHLLSSIHGHGADQILAFQVVTPDGRYHSVTPEENEDLFFAMLGGGGGNYGVLTSAIVKAHPPTPVTTFMLEFQVRPRSDPSTPRMPTVHDVETFWAGVWLYQFAAPIICDAGGTHYSYVRKQSDTSYTFDVRWELPLLSTAQIHNLLSPLYNKLTSLGIPVELTIPPPTLPNPTARPNTGVGAAPGNSYFASRLFPRANWDNATIYNTTFAAIRATTEAGFVFHGVNFWTPPSVAGYTGRKNAIADHWRTAIMHADIFADALDFTRTTPAQFRERHARLEAVMDGIREATPAGGAYFNEADVLEPAWQGTFFGEKYERLVGVKRKRDPWGVFWAVKLPGSEVWEVREEDGLPTQNGRLCLARGRGEAGW